MAPFFRGIPLFFLISLAVILMVIYFLNGEELKEVNTSHFVDLMEEGKVEKVFQEGFKIEATLTDGTEITTQVGPMVDVYAMSEGHGATYNYSQEPGTPWWNNLLFYLLPLGLVIGVLIFIKKQSQSGGSQMMNFGKSKAQLFEPVRKSVSFNDVAGSDEERDELVEIVEFLKAPKKYIEIGAHIPKGVLLVGPPGTGKTLLARAVAGEAGVPFYSISGSNFVEMFVGVGASRVRDLFKNAKKNSPCIIFIDEMDAVGRQRGAGLGGGHDEKEQTLNQLLVEMDGFEINQGIILIAATNRPDVLDPALLRPGRFDRQIMVNYPDIKGREAILQVHVRNKPLSENIDLKVLARRTPGFTGADLENVTNEAALLTARKGNKILNMQEMQDAIDKILGGTEKRSRVISDFEKKLIAFHESGHALVSYLLPHTATVHKVTIIPRSKDNGHTLMLPEEERNYITRSELMDRASVLLAGRVAEQVAMGEISSSAQNDLERVTAMVRQMIMKFGMSKKLGPVIFGEKESQVFLGRDFAKERNFSEEIAQSIDREHRNLVNQCYRRAQEIIENYREKLDLMANALLEKETLNAEEIVAMIEGHSA